jgi:hypothetical protein
VSKAATPPPPPLRHKPRGGIPGEGIDTRLPAPRAVRSRTDRIPCAGTNGKESEISRRARVLAETGNPRPYLPFGVTLIGPAWSDEFLWEIAAKLHAKSGLKCGPTGHGVKPYRSPA